MRIYAAAVAWFRTTTWVKVRRWKIFVWASDAAWFFAANRTQGAGPAPGRRRARPASARRRGER